MAAAIRSNPAPVSTDGFGNGVKIEILNEGGGRELPIFDKLSAQVAYMMVTYRHDHNFINNLNIKHYEKFSKNTFNDKSKYWI